MRLMNGTTRPMTALLGLLPLALAWSPRLAEANCTYTFHPWGPACDVDGTEAECLALSTAELADLSLVFHAIPVWVNTGTTTFEVAHPNAACGGVQPLDIHRSVILSGIPREDMIQSVRAAIGIWNAAATAGPFLVYAGEVSGNTALEENRRIGITIDSFECWTRAVGSATAAIAYPSAPRRDGSEPVGSSYRARIAIVPQFHGLQPADELVETCDDLDPSLQPRPRVVCGDDAPPECDPNAIDCDAEMQPFAQTEHTAIRGARPTPDIVALLVHELGHTLGLDHNFYPEADTPAFCGLGEQLVQGGVYGAMSYEAQQQQSELRIDDLSGTTALYGSLLPLAWPIFHAQRPNELPSAPAHELGLLALPDASASVRLSPGAVGNLLTTAFAYPDEDRFVRVYTLTGPGLDPIPDALAIVDPDPSTGRSFDPAAIAYAPPKGLVDGTILAAWNVEAADSQFVALRWATRATSDVAWTLHGPEAIDISTVGAGVGGGEGEPTFGRRTDDLGLAYDAVHDDFVLTLTSERFSTAVALLDRDGTITRAARELVGDAGGPTPTDDEPVASHNMVGTPACFPGVDAPSTCVLPVASSGEHPELPLVSHAGIVRFNREGALPFNDIEQELIAAHSPCVFPVCPDFTAVGGATVAWNPTLEEGWVGYLDSSGDVDWHEFVRGATGVPEFTALTWSMPGNDQELAGVFDLPDAEQVVVFQNGWPVAPRRPATVSVAESFLSGQVDVLRQHRDPPVCGDGFLDVPPFGVEDCDGTSLDGRSCSDFGFESGVLACSAACTFDTDGCTSCGDGVAAGDEQCDGADLGGSNCATEGFGGGALACTPACTFDTSGCFACTPGEPGCACLDEDVDGPPAEGPLPDGGSLGDGHYCTTDVSMGGMVRCVQDGQSFVCDECLAGQGSFCHCVIGQGCDGGAMCAFACTASPCVEENAALGHGYCFDLGDIPPWFFDAYCAAFADEHVCNHTVAEGNVCIPESEDDGTICVL